MQLSSKKRLYDWNHDALYWSDVITARNNRTSREMTAAVSRLQLHFFQFILKVHKLCANSDFLPKHDHITKKNY